MDRKKILIVSSSFYPKNSPRSHRTTELAKEFALQGHKVTVLTIKNPEFHIKFEKEHRIKIKDIGTPNWKSPDFGNSKIGCFLTRAILRVLSLGFEFPSIELMFLIKKTLLKESGYDLLISIAVPYPVHWGVALVWNKKQEIAKTWSADCGDPFMGNTNDSFKKLFYFKYVEKWFMRKADYITIPIKEARNAYYNEFHNKIKIIPQGFKIKPPTDIIIKHVPNMVPSFAYAGGFIKNIRDPRPFLNYLATIQSNFRFIIFTNNKELVEDYQNKLMGKLEIRDYIPREELLQFLASMDFLVNFDNNTEIALPSKLIDYAICNRPVLNNQKSLDKTIIQEFLNGDYSNAMNLGSIDSYRIENVCASFLELCDAKASNI